MAGIKRYEITEPPTSREVEELAFTAIRRRTLVEGLGLRAIQDPDMPSLPRLDDERSLSFHIRSTLTRDEGGMQILGESLDDSTTVNLALSPDGREPATVTLTIFD